LLKRYLKIIILGKMTKEEILSEYSYLEKEDIELFLIYASQIVNTKS